MQQRGGSRPLQGQGTAEPQCHVKHYSPRCPTPSAQLLQSFREPSSSDATQQGRATAEARGQGATSGVEPPSAPLPHQRGLRPFEELVKFARENPAQLPNLADREAWWMEGEERLLPLRRAVEEARQAAEKAWQAAMKERQARQAAEEELARVRQAAAEEVARLQAAIWKSQALLARKVHLGPYLCAGPWPLLPLSSTRSFCR
jgi:hypothetical protein